MKSRTYILIFILILFGLAFIPTSAYGEHTTCTSEDTKYCGATMDWSYIFEHTTVESNVNFEDVTDGGGFDDDLGSDNRFDESDPDSVNFGEIDTDNPYDQVGLDTDAPQKSLAYPSRRSYRNLFHGIENIRNNSVQTILYGSGPYPDNRTYPGNSSLSKPVYMNTSFKLSWWSLYGNSDIKIDDSGNTYTLKHNNETNETDVSFNTWDADFGIFAQLFSDINSAIIEESWDYSSWNYTGEFKPQTITLNASLPKGSKIKINIYEINEDTGKAGAKLGWAKFTGSGSINDPGSVYSTTKRLRHYDNGAIKFGLDEYKKPLNESQQEEFNEETVFDGGTATYHLQLNMTRDNTSVDSPKLGLIEPIKLGKNVPAYRSSNEIWKGYPSILPSLDIESERGELYSVTSSRDSAFTNSFSLGYTESMVKNFEDQYINNTIYDSTSPKIPRDGPNNTSSSPDTIEEIDRFYHGAINGSDYHVLSNSTNDSFGNHVFFSHAYADLVRSEMSVFYQDDYSNGIEDHDWKTIASKDGVVYALTDVGAGEINITNTNIRAEPHEVERTPREYDELNYNDTLDKTDSRKNKFDIPERYKDEDPYSQSELKTNIIRMNYSIKDITVEPEVGMTYYNESRSIFGGTTYNPFGSSVSSEIKDYGHRQPGSFVIDYDQSDIQEGKDDINDDINVDVSDLNLTGFYAQIEEINITYQIHYERATFVQSKCPDRPDSNGVSVEELDDNKVVGVDAYGEWSINTSNVSSLPEPPDFSYSNQDDRLDNIGTLLSDKVVTNYDEYISGLLFDEGSNSIQLYRDAILRDQGDYNWEEWGNLNSNNGILTLNRTNTLAGCEEAEEDEDGHYLDGLEWKDTTYDKIKDLVNYSNDGATFDNDRDVNHTDSGTYIGYSSNYNNIGGINATETNGGGLLSGIIGDSSNNVDRIIDKDISPSETTYDSYDVDVLGVDRFDQQGPTNGDLSDSFSYDTALGSQLFDSKHHFSRKIDAHGIRDTAWTRSTATGKAIRKTVEVPRTGGVVNRSILVPQIKKLRNEYTGTQDLSEIDPLNGSIYSTSNNTINPNVESVELKIYDYGPTNKSSQVSVKVQGKTIESFMTDKSDSSAKINIHTIEASGSSNLAEYIIKNSNNSKTGLINISLNYSGVNQDNTEDIGNDKRFDYVLTIDTGHPIYDFSSRWGYSTFRDTRYDAAYTFNSEICSIDPNKNCYGYLEHGLPITGLDDKRKYQSNFSQPNPRNISSVEVSYPSNTMIVNPYLIPSSSSINTNDLGLTKKIEPVKDLYTIINNSSDRPTNLLGDSVSLKVNTSGTVHYIDGNETEFKRVERINDSYYAYKSKIDYHTLHEGLAQNDSAPFELENTSYHSYPAHLIDKDDIINQQLITNQGEISSIKNLRFRDGHVRFIAKDSEPPGEPVSVPSVEPELAVIDFPDTSVSGWRTNLSETGLNKDNIEDGVVFAGYKDPEFDKLTRDDINSDAFAGLDGDPIPGQSASGRYVAQEDQAWLYNLTGVQDKIIDDSDPLSIGEFNYSYMHSDACAYDTTIRNNSNPQSSLDPRYCHLDIINRASFNTEYAYNSDMMGHLKPFRTPTKNGSARKVEPYEAFEEFIFTQKTQTYTDWEISGDASWVSRDIKSSSSNFQLFDTPNIELERIANISRSLKSSEIDQYENSGQVNHNIVNQNNIVNPDVQQYKITVKDDHGTPISFYDRNKTLQNIDINRPDPGENQTISEGVCIDPKNENVTVSGSQNNPTNANCFFTNEDGFIYFTLNSSNADVSASQAEMNMSVVGSLNQWWKYPEDARLIEPVTLTDKFHGQPPNYQNKSVNFVISTEIYIIIFIILSLLFVISRVLRTAQPGSGSTTKDLLSTMFQPFTDAIYIFIKFLIYLILLNIIVTISVRAVGSEGFSPFYMLAKIIQAVISKIVGLF